MKAEEYLKEMSRQIPDREVRGLVMEEYKNHLEDAVDALIAKGMNAEEAEEEAVRQMGDPRMAGKDMGRLYSKVLDLKMFLFFWILGALECVAFLASSDSWETEPITLGFFDGMPDAIFHILGLILLLFGFFWSAVEKWVNVGTFYAWAKNWHGGGIVNSAVYLLVAISFLSQGQSGAFMVLLLVLCSFAQLLERAVIESYRNRREAELLWQIGKAETVVYSYKGRGSIAGKKRKIVTEDGVEIPEGAPIMVIGLNGMKPVVAQI